MRRLFLGLPTLAIVLTITAVVTSLAPKCAVNVVLLGCLKDIMIGRPQVCSAQRTMVDDRFLYYRGVSALRSNQPELARRCLSTYICNRPHDPVAGLFLGIAQSKRGDTPAAYRAWRNADAAVFFWKRGVGRGDPSDIETALAIGPTDVGMLYALGSAYAARGREDKAIAAYEAFTRSQHEQSMSYWMASAYISAARGSYAAALEEYRRASRSAPAIVLPRYRVAEMARKVGDLRLAAEEYESILDLAPGELYATVGVAEMHWAMGDIAGAERRLQHAVGAFRTSGLPPLVLANLVLEQNRMDEAVALAEEALRRDPSSLAAQRLRAEALSRGAHADGQE